MLSKKKKKQKEKNNKKNETGRNSYSLIKYRHGNVLHKKLTEMEKTVFLKVYYYSSVL